MLAHKTRLERPEIANRSERVSGGGVEQEDDSSEVRSS